MALWQYGTMEHYGTMAHYDRQEWRMERQLISGGKEHRGMGHLYEAGKHDNSYILWRNIIAPENVVVIMFCQNKL